MDKKANNIDPKGEIIEGAHLEPYDRYCLERAGRDLFEKESVQYVIVDEVGAYAVFSHRLEIPVMVYVGRDEMGNYRLDQSFCSSCKKRPLIPCSHMYATALAAKQLGAK